MSLKNTIEQIYARASKFLFEDLPDAVGTPLAVIMMIAPLALILLAYHIGSKSHPSSVTVMITNFAGNSGGSGVVVYNSKSESIILTNKHVCMVAKKNGGKISLTNGKEHLIIDMVGDRYHDLCLVRVGADLGQSIQIAKKAPELYSPSTITGHPALMPNVITNGHFGGKQIISVVVGTKPCTAEDIKTEEGAFFCLFFGAIPIIKQFESQIVTATIMAGSSGSAVLNADGELAGLVFAGNARGLSYAYIVPFEFVHHFVETGVRKLLIGLGETPWEAKAKGSVSFSDTSRKNMRNRCAYGDLTNTDKKIQTFCEKILNHIDL